jgi:membrane protein required for colicin V production
VDAAAFSLRHGHWVDLAMLAWLLLSSLIGIWRGLLFELLSLAGLLVAWFGCQWAAPHVAPWLPVGEAGSRANHVAALILAFVALRLAWALLSRLLRLLLHATPLQWPDRVLGAGFGALRGVVVLLVVAAVAGFTPVAKAPEWTRSQGAAWLNAALDGIRPLLPIELSQHLPAA